MGEQKWNPEPWQHVHPRGESDERGPYFHEITDANDSPVLDEPTMLQIEPERRRVPVGTMYDGSMDRAVACVNALAGVSDPDAAIRAAREALMLDQMEHSADYTMGEYRDEMLRLGWDGKSDEPAFRGRIRAAAIALLGTGAE